MILESIECPIGIINVVKALYHDGEAYINTAGALYFLFIITSSVLQGRPLSGSLFAICADSFVRELCSRVDSNNRGLIRACAEDIGQVSRSIKTLKYVAPAFAAARKVAGLAFNSVKCVIIPLAPFSDELVETLAEWLRKVSGMAGLLKLNRIRSTSVF